MNKSDQDQVSWARAKFETEFGAGAEMYISQSPMYVNVRQMTTCIPMVTFLRIDFNRVSTCSLLVGR